MATVDNTQAARRLIEEVFGKGNFDAFNEICDAGARIHDPVTGESDLRQEKETCRMYKTAFPDLTPTILGCCAEGDTVVTHWTMTGTHQQPLMGIQPTGKRHTFEVMSVGRFKGGKLVEGFEQWDDGGALAFDVLRRQGAALSRELGAASARTGRHQGLHDLVVQPGAHETGAVGAATKKRHPGLHDLVVQLGAHEPDTAGARTKQQHSSLHDLVEQDAASDCSGSLRQ